MKTRIIPEIKDMMRKEFGKKYDYRIEILESVVCGGRFDRIELINHLIETKNANVNIVSKNIDALVFDEYIDQHGDCIKANERTAIILSELKRSRMNISLSDMLKLFISIAGSLISSVIQKIFENP